MNGTGVPMEYLLALAVTVLLAAVPFALTVRGGRPDLLGIGTIFALGYSASYGLKGALLAIDPSLYVTYPDRFVGSNHIWAAFLVSWTGLLAFYVGLYATTGRCGGTRRPMLWLGEKERRVARFLSLVAVAASAASMLALLLTVSASPWALLSSIEAWGRFRDDLMFAWTDPAKKMYYYLPVWVGFFGLAAIALSTSRTGRRAVFTNVAAIGLTLFSLVLLGSRAYLLSFLVGLLLFRHEFVRRISFRSQVGVLVLVALVGGYLGIVQKSHTEVGATAQSLEFPVNVVFRLSSSYEQFETLSDLLAKNIDHDLGRSIAEDVFLTYAPRSLWPGKPTEFGFIRGQQILFPDYWEAMGGASTYPIGIVGELYFNFWYVGPILGLWFIGWLLGHLRRNAIAYRSAYAPIYCFLAAGFLAPHRWFGSVLLSVVLIGGFFVAVKVLVLASWGSTTTARAAPADTEFVEEGVAVS